MKKLHNIIVASAIVALSSTAAQAENFTYLSQGDAPTVVGGMTPEGMPYGGSYVTGKGTTTWADGSKATYTYKCVATVQPPRDAIFVSHMACDATASDGSFSVAFGCNPIAGKADQQGCVGGLVGKTGRYAGKRGSVTNHGKGSVSLGTGQWYE
jgi:hypothetical protein